MKVFKGFYRLKLFNGDGGLVTFFVRYLYNGYTITIHPNIGRNTVDMIEVGLGEHEPTDLYDEIDIIPEEHPYMEEILDSIIKSHLLLNV